MSEKENGYFDHKIQLDNINNIQFDVLDAVVVNSKASIKITFENKEIFPNRTQFRFVIPYGWEPISTTNNFCSISSSVKGKIKQTTSSLMIIYVLKEEMKPGENIVFSYNFSKLINTAGEMAYLDKVYSALDIKIPGENIFSRAGIKYISMISDKASFFLIKIPTIYLKKPVDIEIVALDKFGNKDKNFNKDVMITGDLCLEFPEEAKLKDGYIKLNQSLTFKNLRKEETKYSSLMQYNIGYTLFPVFPELTSNIGKLHVSCGEINGSSNPIVNDDDYDSQLYWGDTHIHTREFSDGIGTGSDAFYYAKNVVLHDFAALGDHLNQRNNQFMEGRINVSFPYDKTIWTALIKLCKDWSDSNFVTIPAYEWSGRNYCVTLATKTKSPYESISDKVILFPIENAEEAPLIDYLSEEGCFQNQLYESLKDEECAIISHTPISFVMGTSWTEANDSMENVVEIYSSHGSSETINGNYRPLVNNKNKGSVNWALNNGFKLGFIGGGDDHYSHPGCPIRQYKMKNLVPILRYRPGIAAVFSNYLTSKDIIQSINHKKCYATTGERIWMKIKIESDLMGEEINVSKPPLITATVCGTGKLESVELIKNGDVIAIRIPTNDRIKFGYEDTVLKKGENAYYYIRATQFDGERGWTSPIWVNFYDK